MPLGNAKLVTASCDHPLVSLALVHAERAFTPLHVRCAAFARQVRARHDVAEHRPGSLERVFVRRQSASTVVTQQHWQLTIAPRLQMQLATLQRTVQQMHRQTCQVPAAAIGSAPAITSAVVERLSVRERRIHTLERDAVRTILTPEVAGSGATAADVLSRPPRYGAASSNAVERVLRRAATAGGNAAQAAAKRASEVPGVRESNQQSAREPSSSVPPMAAAALDVEHLAERVVRVIDRRLTAQRERFGRL